MVHHMDGISSALQSILNGKLREVVDASIRPCSLILVWQFWCPRSQAIRLPAWSVRAAEKAQAQRPTHWELGRR
jgi:hypothetical protein